MAKNKEKSNQNSAKEWRERSEPLLAVPEDEREPRPHSLPRLSVVPPCSLSSSADPLPLPPSKPRPTPLSHGDESMTMVLSAFYAKLLIVLGVALPITSSIQNDLYTNFTSDIFTIYLYVVSLIFLAYTFNYLKMAKKDSDDNAPRTRYGSFYLHMGVAGFSVGSVIYSCLQMGGYFDLNGDCRLAIVAVKPAIRILFMVAQTVFILSFTHMLDPMRGVVLDRFGLMHLIATNVCEWLNVVIQETRDDIIAVAQDRPSLLRYANITGPSKLVITDHQENVTFIEQRYKNNGTTLGLFDNITIMNETWHCNVSDMITPLIRNVNPYLRPCGKEYSLLCSIIIVVIWNDICTVPGSKSLKSPLKDSKQTLLRVKSSNHFSVDCGSAHKGLFMGVAVLAGTIVSLMLFNGLFQNQKHVELALLQFVVGIVHYYRGRDERGCRPKTYRWPSEARPDRSEAGNPMFPAEINVWETILFLLMAVGSAACIRRMRTLPLRRAGPALPLEHALLLVTQCGVYLYYLFQIIGAAFLIQRFPEGRRATRIVVPLCAVVQSSCQTLLVLDAWSRRCSDRGARAGRQLVTFLLVGNFALWLLNRVKNARAEFHPLQMEFFGVWAWTLITHMSVPLLVCYRFLATVCFYEIWKNSYKRKKELHDAGFDQLEMKNYHIA